VSNHWLATTCDPALSTAEQHKCWHATTHPQLNRRVVLSQLGPGGEGGDLPPTPDYLWLRQFLEEHPLRNGNEWLAEMMAQDHWGQMLGALHGL